VDLDEVLVIFYRFFDSEEVDNNSQYDICANQGNEDFVVLTHSF
jgi:hypothetical protein